MIARILQYLERLSQRYPNRLDYLRARMLIVLGGGMLAVAVMMLILELVTGGLGTRNPLVTIAATLGAGGMVGLILHLGHRGSMMLARLLMVALVYGLMILALSFKGAASFGATLGILGMLLAGVLFGTRGGLLGTALSFLLMAAFALAEFSGSLVLANPTDPADLAIGLAAISVVIAITEMILRLFTGNLQETLANAERRARQLRAVAEIAQVANASLQRPDLLPSLVDMIRDRMVFYHVQIFLLDEAGELAQLVASTGYAGEQLLARGHQLPVGSRSVIGQVTQRGELVYAMDTSTDPVHRANEFLTATRSELALPLLESDRVIGALDVQSTRPHAFSQDDIETLQVMANQISVAVSNARLLRQIQANLEENRALYAQTQETLNEVERLNRQLTGKAWQDYLAGSKREFSVLVEGERLSRQVEWSPTLAQATREARVVAGQAGENPVIAVPLDVRGQVLGALEVTLPSGVGQQDAQELIEAVAARLALALDNSRLFEEAQALAQQEHVINELGGRLQTVGDVDEMLRLTLTELSRALGADSASVRLQGTPLLPTTGNGQD